MLFWRLESNKKQNEKNNWFMLLAMLMMALVSVGFTSCSSDDDDGVGGDITGSWYVPYDVEGDVAIAFLTFKTDGICTTEEYILFPNKGWKLDNQESRKRDTRARA